MTPDPIWCLIPVVNNLELTRAAVTSLLAQSVPTEVLLILQGVDDDLRTAAEGWAEREPRLHLWPHQPPLPSLSASWNAGLRFVWGQGGEVALVANNDIVCHHRMIELLHAALVEHHALFVSAVGVLPEQFDPTWEPPARFARATFGGPDFSCYLIARACHERYQFDEGHVPAYREDCCFHRETILGGNGDNIFSVNIPFAHHASATINAPGEDAARWARRLAPSVAYYERCWGGPVNGERYTIKGDPTTAQDGVTNRDLFDAVREEWRATASAPL